EMARLQLGPQTTSKPRILAQSKIQNPLPTPASSRSPAQPIKPNSHINNEGPFATPRATSMRRTPKTTGTLYEDSVFDDDDDGIQFDEEMSITETTARIDMRLRASAQLAPSEKSLIPPSAASKHASPRLKHHPQRIVQDSDHEETHDNIDTAEGTGPARNMDF